jgi:hypothetical protein
MRNFTTESEKDKERRWLTRAMAALVGIEAKEGRGLLVAIRKRPSLKLAQRIQGRTLF